MWAKARGLDYLELFVLDENEGAFQFYQGNGFKTVSKTMRYRMD
jgi:ribosomal protein S18 acetylase RimI-like enzyme